MERYLTYRPAPPKSRADKPFVPANSAGSGKYHRLEARHLEVRGSPYPKYPIPVPPEKLKKAGELYRTYKDMIALRSSPRSTSSGSRADSVLSDKDSVLSFASKSSSFLDIPLANTEFGAFNDQKTKKSRRSVFNPVDRAKTALIRCLGSCSTCHDRRVPCPLEHHDIDSLERTHKSKPQLPYDKDRTPNQKWKDLELQVAGVSGGPEVDESLICKPAPAQVLNSSISEDSLAPRDNPLDNPDVLSLNLASTDTLGKVPWTGPTYKFEENEAKHDLQTSSSTKEENHDANLIDWNAGLAKVVRTACHAAFGSAMVLPSLLIKLYSIFNNENFLSDEPAYDFDDGFNSTSDASSISRYLPDGPAESSSNPFSSGTGDQGVPDQVPSDNSTPPKVGVVRPTGNPSTRVKRRLRCQFNARYPHKYCATRATENRFHACAKAGCLTMAHLKQHLLSTHESFRCDRCGKLFDDDKAKTDHSRADVSEICSVVPEDLWPGTDQAESIDAKMRKRIEEQLSARGYHGLDSKTKDAIEAWISANIIEYVGDGHQKQDRVNLRNWYLIWLALFPGVPVPKHPFYDGPSETTIKDDRYIEVFREILIDKVKNRKLNIPPQYMDQAMNQILESAREAQDIVRTVTRETHDNARPIMGEESRAIFETPPQTSQSGIDAIRPRTPNHQPPPKRRKNNPPPPVTRHVQVTSTPEGWSMFSMPGQIAAPNINPPVNAPRDSGFGTAQQLQQTDNFRFNLPRSQSMANAVPWSSTIPWLGDRAESPALSFSSHTGQMMYPGAGTHGTPTTTSFQEIMQDSYEDPNNWYNVEESGDRNGEGNPS